MADAAVDTEKKYADKNTFMNSSRIIKEIFSAP